MATLCTHWQGKEDFSCAFIHKCPLLDLMCCILVGLLLLMFFSSSLFLLPIPSELNSGTLLDNSIHDGSELQLVPALESGVTVSGVCK